MDRAPTEVKAAGDGVDRADGQFDGDLDDDAPGHRDTPVVYTVVDDKELEQEQNQQVYYKIVTC